MDTAYHKPIDIDAPKASKEPLRVRDVLTTIAGAVVSFVPTAFLVLLAAFIGWNAPDLINFFH